MSKLNSGSAISKSVLLANFNMSSHNCHTVITVAKIPNSTERAIVVFFSLFILVASEEAICEKYPFLSILRYKYTKMVITINVGTPTVSCVTNCLKNTERYPISLNHIKSAIKPINATKATIISITTNKIIDTFRLTLSIISFPPLSLQRISIQTNPLNELNYIRPFHFPGHWHM